MGHGCFVGRRANSDVQEEGATARGPSAPDGEPRVLETLVATEISEAGLATCRASNDAIASANATPRNDTLVPEDLSTPPLRHCRGTNVPAARVPTAKPANVVMPAASPANTEEFEESIFHDHDASVQNVDSLHGSEISHVSRSFESLVQTLDLRDAWEGQDEDWYPEQPSGLTTFSAVKGPLGVTALSLADPSKLSGTSDIAGLGATMTFSPDAVRGQSITWVKGEMIGRGSLGSVYSALDQHTGQLIAVKEVVINAWDKNDLCFKEALEGEISILQNLKHPHIVSFLGHDCLDSCLYVYLEYMPGGSMTSVLRQFGPLDESLLVVYARELLEGLEYLHTRHPPVVHRDIKGANVLVGLDCKVKLSDFGCSKRAMETFSRTMKGSIPWMAPEVIAHTGYGRAADVWSFGCVMIEMATGNRPWGDCLNNPIAACAKIAMSEETPPVPESLSRLCRDFIDSCLRREPIVRPSVAELLQHVLVQDITEGSPERRSAKDYVDTTPDYGLADSIFPGLLE